MSLVSQLDGRKDLRRRYAGMARVRCRRCQRVVGECYGDYGKLEAAWPNSARPEPGGDRAVRWTCRCGGNYPVTGASSLLRSPPRWPGQPATAG
jgi:hypothetical protein